MPEMFDNGTCRLSFSLSEPNRWDSPVFLATTKLIFVKKCEEYDDLLCRQWSAVFHVSS